MWERGFSAPHILLLILIILLLFGAKRIPDLARSLGRSIGEFKKGRAEGERESRESDKERLEKSDPPKSDPPKTGTDDR